jgi:hypothetical protein
MDAYSEAGGSYRQASPREVKQQIREDRKAAERLQGSRGIVTSCPDQPPAKPSPPPAPEPDSKCPCKVTAVKVSCCHEGRSAKDNLLMVVPSHGGGDDITVAVTASGNCSSELVVRADGQQGYPRKGAGSSGFKVRGPLNGGGGTFSLWDAKPDTIYVSAEACGTSLETIRVEAYPSNKVLLKIDAKSLREKCNGILAYLPINSSEPRERIRPISKDEKLGQKPGFLSEVELTAESEWKEDKNSHLAFCESSLIGEVSWKHVFPCYPLWGVPVPPQLQRYLKAGIYVQIEVSASVESKCSWAYWPHEDSTKWHAVHGGGTGKGSVELAAELLLLSEDIVQAKASGRAEVAFKALAETGKHHKSPVIKGKFEISPLTAAVAFKLAWGLIEYERSWSIFDARETDLFKIWPR